MDVTEMTFEELVKHKDELEFELNAVQYQINEIDTQIRDSIVRVLAEKIREVLNLAEKYDIDILCNDEYIADVDYNKSRQEITLW